MGGSGWGVKMDVNGNVFFGGGGGGPGGRVGGPG